MTPRACNRIAYECETARESLSLREKHCFRNDPSAPSARSCVTIVVVVVVTVAVEENHFGLQIAGDEAAQCRNCIALAWENGSRSSVN
jgi:hypothetical protein